MYMYKHVYACNMIHDSFMCVTCLHTCTTTSAAAWVQKNYLMQNIFLIVMRCDAHLILCDFLYRVATLSRLLKIIGLCCRI